MTTYLACCKIFAISRVYSGEAVRPLARELCLPNESTLRGWKNREGDQYGKNYYQTEQKVSDDIVKMYNERIVGVVSEEEKLNILKQVFVTQYALEYSSNDVTQQSVFKKPSDPDSLKMFAVLRTLCGESAKIVCHDLDIDLNDYNQWLSMDDYDEFLYHANIIREKYEERCRINFCPLHRKADVLVAIFHEYPQLRDWTAPEPIPDPYAKLRLCLHVLYLGSLQDVSSNTGVDEAALKNWLTSDIDHTIYERHAFHIWNVYSNNDLSYRTEEYKLYFLGALFQQYIRQGKASEISNAYQTWISQLAQLEATKNREEKESASVDMPSALIDTKGGLIGDKESDLTKIQTGEKGTYNSMAGCADDCDSYEGGPVNQVRSSDLAQVEQEKNSDGIILKK